MITERSESHAAYDAILADIMQTYRAKPYTGRDPHGLFPYVEALVTTKLPEWSERMRMLMTVAAIADIITDITEVEP